MTIVELLITGFIALLMAQTGMSCDLAALRSGLTKATLKAFLGLTALNFVAIPVFTLALFTPFLGQSPMGLALIALAILPCAPVVPTLANSMGDDMEWPVTVFILFSIISLFVVAIVTFLLPGHNHDDLALYFGLFRYLLIIYIPLFLGIAFRWRWPTEISRLASKARPAIGIGFVTMAIFYIGVNVGVVSRLPLSDLAIMIAFSIMCIALALATPRGAGGPINTLILATAFRNVALAMPFSILILRNSEVTIHVVLCGTIASILAVVVTLIMKQYHHRILEDHT